MMFSTLLFVLLTALLASLAVTPLVRAFALRVHLVDKPDAHRKMHGRAIPLGGGVAVLVATFVATGALMPGVIRKLVIDGRSDLIGLAAAVAFLCAVGLLDDARGLRARQKLAGQIVACLIAMASGLIVPAFSIFGIQVELGIMAWPFTMLWLLVAINALNLIDGADGLATTVGIILCGALAAMAMMNGHMPEAVVAVALMGSLIGFLYFNFPPASIFLGDAGSMVIGLLAGALAIRSSVKGPAAVAMLAPLAIWALPMLDVSVAVLRRKLTGRSLATTDRGHLHHCILRRGYGNRQLLAWVAGLSLIASSGAPLGMYLQQDVYAVAGVVVVVVVLVTTRMFGHAEFLLVATSVRDLGASLITPSWRGEVRPRNRSLQLQGSRPWDQLWKMLTEAAHELNLARVRLDLNLPWIHESYHAAWQQDETADRYQMWHADVPLTVQGRFVGRLRVSGPAADGRLAIQVTKCAHLLEMVEDQLARLLDESAASPPPADPWTAGSDPTVAPRDPPQVFDPGPTAANKA